MKAVKHRENSTVSAWAECCERIRLIDRLTVDLIIFLLESGGHKNMSCSIFIFYYTVRLLYKNSCYFSNISHNQFRRGPTQNPENLLRESTTALSTEFGV